MPARTSARRTSARRTSARRTSARRTSARRTSARIQLRHYLALRGPLTAIALVTAALAALLAAAPAVFARLADQEITQTVAHSPLSARYLTARPAGRILPTPSRDPAASGLGDLDGSYGGWQDQLADLRRGLPTPLRSHIGPAAWTISYDAVDVGPNPGGDPASSRTTIGTVVDLHPERVARLVEGTWPDGAFGDLPLSVAVSRATATGLGGGIGSVFGDYRIVGIFEPDDPAADYWQLNPGLARHAVYDDGNSITVAATAFIGPDQAGLRPLSSGGFSGSAGQVLVWYPLDLSGMTPPVAQRILAQLNRVAAAPRPVPPDAENLQPDALRGAIVELSLDVGVIDILAASLGRIDAASAVLQVALAGPLIAAIAVLIATVLMALRRGAPAAQLLQMRGASRIRLRLHWIGAGLIAGVPAAVLAVLAVRLSLDAGVTALLLGAAIGLLPALLLGGAPLTSSVSRRGRAGATRWIAESAAVLLAGVSVYLLLASGVGEPGDSGAGAAGAGLAAGRAADILVVAAPALTIAAACAVVLRLYPIPLRGMASWMRRRRGAVGFIGSLRSLRDPVVGTVPVVAVLASVAVAGMSVSLLATIDTGTDRAGASAIGAPIRVTETAGHMISDAQYAQIEDLDGVKAAARLAVGGTVSVKVPGRNSKPSAQIIRADLTALAAVQQGLDGGVPAVSTVTSAGELVGVGSASLAPAGAMVTVSGRQVRIGAAALRVPGVSTARTFLLLDGSAADIGSFRPMTVLVRPAQDADPQQVAAAVAEIIGPSTTVVSAAEMTATLQSGAMARGMRVALYAALATAALVMIAALLLSVVTAAATRARLMAIARVLGLARRQRQALVLWEQAPVAFAALIGGGALGVGLAVLVNSAVDLSPFTGGAAAPPLVVDWARLALLLTGFVVVVLAAVSGGIVLTRRSTAARMVDEE